MWHSIRHDGIKCASRTLMARKSDTYCMLKGLSQLKMSECGHHFLQQLQANTSAMRRKLNWKALIQVPQILFTSVILSHSYMSDYLWGSKFTQNPGRAVWSSVFVCTLAAAGGSSGVALDQVFSRKSSMHTERDMWPSRHRCSVWKVSLALHSKRESPVFA